jgi:hypothetical protein
MPDDAKAPKIDDRIACIVDRDSVVLAAVISSYLFAPGTYLPLFLFPRVEVSKVEEASLMTEAYVADLFAGESGYMIGNALARAGCEYVILAGLNEHQKTFLRLPPGLKIVEIAELSDVYPSLSPLDMSTKGELRCKASDALEGLNIAQRQEKRLVIDESAPEVNEQVELRKGLVIVESLTDASPVIAINYANAVDASISIVDPLGENEGREIQSWIREWKENDDTAQFQRINDAVTRRINRISPNQFEYVTFFTEGLPYSLILENIIPCSYVHLSLRPDLFVFNNIVFKNGDNFHAAVVFSPVFFADEETEWLCDFFSSNNYYLRPLIGDRATVANLDFHAQFFPYDVLHICSHGGEVKGYEMSIHFLDKDGNPHFVEFDEVVGFTPAPDKPDMVAVVRKMFPRKLDGFAWMSPEFDRQNIPKHVCREMWKFMMQARGRRTPKDRIAMSCAIACADSIHQGALHTLASFSSPLIFNNTCWSSYEVASFFLACGARGYVGTLWDIDNQAAVLAAQTFYENLFGGAILTSFHRALKAIETTSSKDIYVYWGLHFTTLSPGQSTQKSRLKVRNELMHAVNAWIRHIESTRSPERKSNSIRVLRSILRELLSSFDSNDIRALETKLKERIPELRRTDISRENEESEARTTRSLIDYPIEDAKDLERVNEDS